MQTDDVLWQLRPLGKGGVPMVQIVGNELECLGDRKVHDGHFAKQFLKKILFLAGYRVAIWLSLLGNS